MTLLDRFGLEGKAALVVGGGYGSGARRPCSSPRRARGSRWPTSIPCGRRTSPTRWGAWRSSVTSPIPKVPARSSTTHPRLGGLDRVANIVGLATFVEDIFAIDTEVWEHDLRMNLVHHLDVSRAAARHMIDDGTGGAFALVASVSGFYGAAGHAAYGAAKAGVMSLARAMASEWGPYGIRVNCVAPDVIMTPRLLAGQVVPPEGTPPGDEVVLGRWGKPEDIAGPLVFLLSELSSFMTGRTLVVDGGSMVHFPHGGVGARRPSP